jgi:predicted DNA-binding transcriptional regulator AlpA
LSRLLLETLAAYKEWVDHEQADQVETQRAKGDRLMSVAEIAKRLSRSEVSVYRAFKTGQYPFMMKDGGKLVGSEDGLERWIRNRTKSHSA